MESKKFKKLIKFLLNLLQVFIVIITVSFIVQLPMDFGKEQSSYTIDGVLIYRGIAIGMSILVSTIYGIYLHFKDEENNGNDNQ